MKVLDKVLSPLALTAIACLSASAENPLITLDLTQANPPLEFNTETGAWTGTYDDDEESIESQCFSFHHNSISDWLTWWGFTASNSADNSFRQNFITYQFSNMAQGGIQLNEDGTVKTDDFGAPVTSAEMPYLVAFYSPYMAARPVQVTFNTDKAYEPVGVYLNLNSYTYYSIQNGDGFARAFTNDDSYRVTIHGVTPEGTENSVEVELGAYDNGNLTINRGWRYVDLTGLGTVTELYFTIFTTDSGAYGANTPQYFCLDKLMVRENGPVVGIPQVQHQERMPIRYDRMSGNVLIPDNQFAGVYDMSGNLLITSEQEVFNISNLPYGMYVIRSANHSLKIIR